MRWIVCLLLLLVACQRTPTSDRSASPPKGTDLDAPIVCAQDGDCPGLACGPCQPGSTVTRRRVTESCVVNPCPGRQAVCRNRVCMVQ